MYEQILKTYLCPIYCIFYDSILFTCSFCLSFIPQTYDSPWLSSPPLPCAPQGILKAEEKTETLFPGFPKHSQSALLSTKTDFTEKEL